MRDPIGEKDRPFIVDDQAVQVFAARMMEKLRANKHKAHWSIVDDQWLLSRLINEVAELNEAIANGDSESIKKECADVANFAMMIADSHQDKNK